MPDKGTQLNFKDFFNANIIMILNKAYSTMTLDQLLSEEKKLKSQKIPYALFIGVLVSIAIWSATHKGGAYTFILLTFALFISSRYSKSLKGIQTEISIRDAIR